MRRSAHNERLLVAPVRGVPGIPRRWTWFIALSTGLFLGVAGVIALWFPQYAAVAWALLLFSSCQASFLIVQRVGCELPSADAGPEEDQPIESPLP